MGEWQFNFSPPKRESWSEADILKWLSGAASALEYLMDQPRHGAGRAAVVPHLPPGRLAELLPGGAVLPGPTRKRRISTSARWFPIRALRCQSGDRRRFGPVRQDRTRNPRDSFAQRRTWMARSHEEPERASDRRLRAGQRLCLPGGRSAAANGELGRPAGRGGCAVAGIHEADDPHRHLLRDSIPAEPNASPGQDNWRVRLAMASSGRMPSIAGAAMSRWSICPSSAFAATRTSPSRT